MKRDKFFVLRRSQQNSKRTFCVFQWLLSENVRSIEQEFPELCDFQATERVFTTRGENVVMKIQARLRV